MIFDNPWITIRGVANDVSILFGLCQAIFMDVLGRKRAATKIVPKLLNFEQKTMSHEHRSGGVGDVQQWYRFAQKDHNSK